MSSSKINEAVKEAVIAEVKKLTGYNRKPSGPWVFRKEGIKVKIQGRTLCIYTRDTSITINLERTDSSDLIWQKAAEMLEICKEVQKTEDDPKRKKVLEVIKAKAQECLGWDSFDVQVTEDAGFDEFWATIEKFYGKEVPSPEGSDLIDLRINQGLSRANYLEIIVDEVLKHLNKPHQDYTYPETIFPDKSVGYYFNQLKEPLRTKALSQAKNLSEPAGESLLGVLECGLVWQWGDTKEGYTFWSDVCRYFNSGKIYEDSEGSKLAAQCAPDNYVFPNPPKKEAPEYIPPTPPVNPIEVALAEIDKLKIRVAELESDKKEPAADMITVEQAKNDAYMLYSRAKVRTERYGDASREDFEFAWKAFCTQQGVSEDVSEVPAQSDYTPTPEQCEALWLLVKDGIKLPNALPFKFSPHMFQPNVLRVDVLDNFEFSIAPNKFYPFVNSKGERPTFDQCRQAIAGTLASTLETLFNDEVK